MSRPINPILLRRLDDEAYSIHTQIMDSVDRRVRDLSNHAANWQPGPMPDDWVPSGVQEIYPDPTSKHWQLSKEDKP